MTVTTTLHTCTHAADYTGGREFICYPLGWTPAVGDLIVTHFAKNSSGTNGNFESAAPDDGVLTFTIARAAGVDTGGGEDNTWAHIAWTQITTAEQAAAITPGVTELEWPTPGGAFDTAVIIVQPSSASGMWAETDSDELDTGASPSTTLALPAVDVPDAPCLVVASACCSANTNWSWSPGTELIEFTATSAAYIETSASGTQTLIPTLTDSRNLVAVIASFSFTTSGSKVSTVWPPRFSDPALTSYSTDVPDIGDPVDDVASVPPVVVVASEADPPSRPVASLASLAVQPPEWVVFERDDDLNRVAEVPFSSLDLVLRWQEPHSWAMKLGDISSTLRPGRLRGVEIVRNGVTLCSGRCYARRPSSIGGVRSVEVAGRSDLQLLWERLTSPQPGTESAPYDAAAYYTLSGQASSIVRQLVADQTGSTATPARRLPIELGPDPLAGLTLAKSVRWKPSVGEVAEQIVVESGADLGLDVSQNGSVLTFSVRAPMPTDVLFSDDVDGVGNLASWALEESVPTATHVVAAGQGEGVGRSVAERSSALYSRYGRVEMFLDYRNAASLAELRAAAGMHLRETPFAVTAVPSMNAGYLFGRDYQLGDQVRVEITSEGVSLRETIREVVCTVTPDGGEQIRPVIRDVAAGDPMGLGILEATTELARRLAQLEGAT